MINEKINNVLSQWDPLNVGEEISRVEYKGYVPKILNSSSNFILLVNTLESILVNDLGLEYKHNNIEHKKDLLFFAYEIFLIRESE